jgi:hypothetical protein
MKSPNKKKTKKMKEPTPYPYTHPIRDILERSKKQKKKNA